MNTEENFCNDPRCELNRQGKKHASHVPQSNFATEKLSNKEKSELKSKEKEMGKKCLCGHYKVEHHPIYKEIGFAEAKQFNFVRESCKKCECPFYRSTGRIFRDSNIG